MAARIIVCRLLRVNGFRDSSRRAHSIRFRSFDSSAGLMLLCGAAVACSAPRPKATSPVAVFPSGAEFMLEVAADDAARQRGYMERERIGPLEGMLFLSEQDERYAFWMKNCKVALDMIWLDADLRVVDVAHDVPPCPAEGSCPS